MGMNYKIDQERRLVVTRGWGVLTARELFDATSRILVDPRFDPTYRSLGDLRDVTEVTLDTLETANTAATPLFATGTRRAIVAPADAVYGMARMFATFAERSGQEVRIFRELEPAEKWLGL
jgi:hypothetical protein